MHAEDIQMILEMGANSIRLAHYQHDQFFYDLCDEKGLVAWAEIPYISEHMPEANENTISQMTELVVQNYNHPSIICWALSNEITVTGVTDDLIQNHHRLNDLVHHLDQTRVTAMANVFILDTDSPLIDVPDIMSYNLYFGWYVGELGENDEFFDKFHTQYPDKIVGLSEYGADTFYKLQSPEPVKGDYSEQYQCIYHEHMLEMFSTRPYLWSTYVWNMFDFAADGREEADDNGVNHKGLVTFDRTVKKDAYYIYKAWWSKEPFVHLCGSRYVDRTEKVTEIKVYSNQSSVALYKDGELMEEKDGKHIFTFQISIDGIHEIEAKCGELSDHMKIKKVAEPNLSYRLKNAAVRNWFDEPGMEVIPGYFSIKDKIGDIKQTPEGKALIDVMMQQAVAAFGDVAKNVQGGAAMEQMMNNSTMESMAKMAGGAISPDMIVAINKQLNKIKKTEG
jgi:beta-galactosidase